MSAFFFDFENARKTEFAEKENIITALKEITLKSNIVKIVLSFLLMFALNSKAYNLQVGKDSSTYFYSKSQNENKHLPQNYVHYNRLIVSSLGIISLNIAAYQPFKKTWWEEERTAFHFYHGWQRKKGHYDLRWNDSYFGHMDKLGHYYTSKILSEQLVYLSRWIGFSQSSSNWIGPLLSSIMLLEIEIYDGFFKEWGFSLADLAANEVGAFSPLFMDKVPYTKNFYFKFSYHASHQPGNEATFIKDYAGMTFWISWDLSSALPRCLNTYYPQWMNFALGYGVSKQAHGDIELYLSPDINWEKVPLGNSETARFFKTVLNYFHFPCITWQIRPQGKFYLLYF